jgi:hypothetical protein
MFKIGYINTKEGINELFEFRKEINKVDQEKIELAEAVIELAEHLPEEVYLGNPVAVDSWVRLASKIMCTEKFPELGLFIE